VKQSMKCTLVGLGPLAVNKTELAVFQYKKKIYLCLNKVVKLKHSNYFVNICLR